MKKSNSKITRKQCNDSQKKKSVSILEEEMKNKEIQIEK